MENFLKVIAELFLYYNFIIHYKKLRLYKSPAGETNPHLFVFQTRHITSLCTSRHKCLIDHYAIYTQ